MINDRVEKRISIDAVGIQMRNRFNCLYDDEERKRKIKKRSTISRDRTTDLDSKVQFIEMMNPLFAETPLHWEEEEKESLITPTQAAKKWWYASDLEKLKGRDRKSRRLDSFWRNGFSFKV